MLVPLSIPFTLHWYCGDVPPFAIVAVNNTGLPSHDGFAAAVMLIETGFAGNTVIVIGFDIAGLFNAQL